MVEQIYNYKMTIAYDGTCYSGWQNQPNGVSIQAKIEEAIKVVIKRDVKVIGSGRTDAGVHALGQIANFQCDCVLDLYRFIASLNGILPRDICLKLIEKVPLDFHSQKSALGKVYHYHLSLSNFQSPFKRLYSYHIKGKIDVELLKQGALLFVGTHDFTSFANEAHLGAAAVYPIKNLKRLDILEEEEGVRLEFEGDGFLYKMVRNIVGTLLEVARGKLHLGHIEAIFQAKDRKKAAMAVPPQGLFLVEVYYNSPYVK
jgi:tRNA pseudouridine38-40 synthase